MNDDLLVEAERAVHGLEPAPGDLDRAWMRLACQQAQAAAVLQLAHQASSIPAGHGGVLHA
jgi:hypothetical protein